MDVGREQYGLVGTADWPAVSVDFSDSNGLACVPLHHYFSKSVQQYKQLKRQLGSGKAEVRSLNRDWSFHKAPPVVGRTKSVH